jgi:hypothetical protein
VTFLRAAAAGLLLAALTAACGSAPPSPSPPPRPTPSPAPTPVARLTTPFRAGEVILALREAGLEVVGNTARAGLPGTEPRTTMYATYGSWPLMVMEYSSAAALRKASGFAADDRILPGDPPFAFAAANLLIEYGPKRDGKKPVRPDLGRQAMALALVLALDPRVGPLRQRSISPLPLPTPAPTPVPSPGVSPNGAAGSGASPGRSPRPSASPRRSPRPTASP